MVALKVLVASGSGRSQDFLKAVELELQVMRKARHPHIVTCFGICVQVSQLKPTGRDMPIELNMLDSQSCYLLPVIHCNGAHL